MSGYEKKVKSHIETDIRKSSPQENIGNIILPIEKIIHYRNVNQIFREKVNRSYSVIIEACFRDYQELITGDILHSIKKRPGVINVFTDKTGNPIPMNPQYITSCLVKVSELADANTELRLSIGEKVKVIYGPVKGFYGPVDTIRKTDPVDSSSSFGKNISIRHSFLSGS